MTAESAATENKCNSRGGRNDSNVGSKKGSSNSMTNMNRNRSRNNNGDSNTQLATSWLAWLPTRASL